MPDALVAADLHLAADVGGHLTTEVTLNLEVALNEVAKRDQLRVGEVLDAQIGADPGRGEDLRRSGTANAIDVGERDLDALVAREVDAD